MSELNDKHAMWGERGARIAMGAQKVTALFRIFLDQYMRDGRTRKVADANGCLSPTVDGVGKPRIDDDHYEERFSMRTGDPR